MANEHEPRRSKSADHSINPYEVGHVRDPQVIPDTVSRAMAKRHFRLRMDWSDRRTFLRLVGPLRLAAVAGGVLGFSGLYSLISGLYESWRLGDASAWAEPLMIIRWFIVALKAVLGFYACWLQWLLADAIAMTAGGTTTNMRAWSEVQRRIVWLILVTLAVNVGSLAWDWLWLQLMSKAPFGL